MNRTDIDQTFREMWSTRPHRRKDDRKIAGVAAAIGRRYGIDPILVRVAFVVATIYGGVGIPLYLLGWLLLPEEGDEVSGAEALFGHGQSSMSRPLTVVLLLALIPAFSGAFWRDVSGVFALLLVAAALYLLHRSRGDTPPPQPSDQPNDSVSDTPPTAPSDGAPADRTPPAWDPLGVAPFAWDLPEPSPPPAPAEPPARRRSIVTPITLGLALLVAGAGTILALTGDWIGPQQVAALTLAVLGGGLVVGAFRNGGRGLIVFAIPLALLTYGMAVTSIDSFNGFRDQRWQATTVADVQPRYELSAGHATLDLSQLRLTSADRVQSEVKLGAGEVNVVVPENADVEVHCRAGAGNVACLDGQTHGFGPRQDRVDFGPDGEGGGKIVLDVSVGAGQIGVHRG
jgi:phage shock protein PspC (stress-responsive transcriptional regulator)